MCTQHFYKMMVPMFIYLSFLTYIPSTSQIENTAAASVRADPETTKVLFVGASYFSYNNLPNLYEELIKASGKAVAITTYIINGTYLEQFAQNAAVVELIKQKKWDFVFLHESGPPVGYPDTHYLFIPPYIQRHTYAALEQFKQIIVENSDKTKMIFLMPWAFEDGLTWIPGQTDTFEDMQWNIYYNTIKWAKEIGFIIAPAGWTWRAVIIATPQLHYLFQPDWNHPSLRGSYLTACVLYVTAYKESVRDNSYLGGLDQSEAGYFQQVASAIVLNDLELWNIPVSAIHDPAPSSCQEFKLHDNFPNPFNPKTAITYNLPTECRVMLRVVDILGQTVTTLVEKIQDDGRLIGMLKMRRVEYISITLKQPIHEIQ